MLSASIPPPAITTLFAAVAALPPAVVSATADVPAAAALYAAVPSPAANLLATADPSGPADLGTPAQNPGALPDTVDDAYLDATARRLIAGARTARDSSLDSVASYTAVLRERFLVEAPSLRRNRAFLDGERAERFRWARDEPDIVRLLGSRRRYGGGERYEPLLEDEGRRWATGAFRDPFTNPFIRSLVRLSPRPLDDDAERFYRFRTVDTTTLRLPSGGSVRAVKVAVVPRFRSVRLLSAILWIEPESFMVVRVAYRLAKKMDSELSYQIVAPFWRPASWDVAVAARDGAVTAIQDGEERASRAPDPWWLRLLDRAATELGTGFQPLPEMDVSTVVVNYEPSEFGRWVPRSAVLEGHFSVATEDLFRIEAEGGAVGGASGFVVPFAYEWTLTMEDVQLRRDREEEGVRLTSREVFTRWSEWGDSIIVGTTRTTARELPSWLEWDKSRHTIRIVPWDEAALGDSDFLPSPLWDGPRGGPNREEREKVRAELARIVSDDDAEARWGRSPWSFEPPLLTLRLLRRNVVEGRSVGTRLRRDFAWGRGALTVRMPRRRLEPDVDLTVDVDRSSWRLRGSVHHSLFAIGGERGPHALAATYGLGHLAIWPYYAFAAWPHADFRFGPDTDSTDYYMATGTSLEILPRRGERPWGSLRMFAERQRSFGSGGDIRRVGAELGWRPWWGGFSPRSAHGGGEVRLRTTVGDHRTVGGLVSGALVVPVALRWSLGLEAGAGRTSGDPAPQDLWYLGETGDRLRGYPSHALTGSSLWWGRAEIGRRVRFLRFSLFGDGAGAHGRDLYSAGFGVSSANGFLRLDLARALSSWTDPEADDEMVQQVWRVHLRGDAAF